MKSVLLLLFFSLFSVVGSSAPEQPHLSLTHNVTEMAITYVTRPKSNPAPASVVFYGESASRLNIKQTGSAKTYTDGGWNGWIHNVVLSGLKPNNTYYYQCGEEHEGGTVHSFVSAPQSKDIYPVTVAYVADLGEECALDECGNRTFDKLAEGTEKSLYNLIIHAGDIAYTDGNQSVWDEFFLELEPIAANQPYMTIPGNHGFLTEHWFNFSGYKHRFYMPGEAPGTVNNLWNSYDFAGIHFVAVSTEHDFAPGSMQYNWLKTDLAKAQQNRDTTPWLIMYGHRPFYCSSVDYYDCHIFGPEKFRPALEPLLREYDVDMYLSGHLHNYECMWPVYNGTVLSHSYINPPSTVHIVAGMAGCIEGLSHKFESPSPDWSNVREVTLGYVVFTFESPTKLTWRYLSSQNNSVIDSFTLSKSRQ